MLVSWLVDLASFFSLTDVRDTERSLIACLVDLIGFPPGASGYITAGASSATLAAIATARETKQLHYRDYSK